MRLVCDRHRYHIYFSTHFSKKKNSVSSISNFCCMFDIFLFGYFLEFGLYLVLWFFFLIKFSNAIERKNNRNGVRVISELFCCTCWKIAKEKCGYNTLDLLFFSSFEHTGIHTQTHTQFMQFLCMQWWNGFVFSSIYFGFLVDWTHNNVEVAAAIGKTLRGANKNIDT